MKLSIVIPTYNEERFLPGLLKSIRLQDYPCEIIVADAESSDATVMIARAFGCKVVKSRRGTPAFGRNAGAIAASGDLLLFLDADVKLPKDFLKKNINEMYSKRYDFAGCYLNPDSRRIFDKIIMSGVVNVWSALSQYIWPNAMGVCIFARKEPHMNVGGFDETITFAEDSAYVNKAHRAGFKFGLLKSSRVLISMRRFDKEGRIGLTLRYLRYNLGRFTGEIRTKVKYDYGHY